MLITKRPAPNEGHSLKTLVRILLAAIAGALSAVTLELTARLLWPSYYSRYPLEGYVGAMAEGLVDPGIYMSAMGFRHAWIAYFLCGAVIALLDRRRALLLAALFAFGSVAVHSAFAAAAPDFMDSNLAPLTPLFMAFYSVPPLAAGVVVGLLAGWARSLVGHLRR